MALYLDRGGIFFMVGDSRLAIYDTADRTDLRYWNEVIGSLMRSKGDRVGACAKWNWAFIRTSAMIDLSPYRIRVGPPISMRASAIVNVSPFLTHQ